MMLRIVSIFAIAGISVLQAASFDTLSGTVKDDNAAAITGAVVSLAKKGALKDTTNEQGMFSIAVPTSGTAMSYGMTIDNAPQIGIQGKRLQFLINSRCRKAAISVFKSDGRLLFTIRMGSLNAGVQKQILPELAAGFYLMQIATDDYKTTLHLFSNGSDYYLDDVRTNTSSVKFVTGVAALTAIDTLVASKEGYDNAKMAIESYTKKNVAIVIQKTAPAKCSTFTLPANGDLKTNAKLPDPFTFLDGTKWTKKSQWPCRRAEMFALAQQYLYGHMPPKPDSVWGSVSGGTINVNCKYQGKTMNFEVKAEGSSGDILVLSYGMGLPAAPTGSRTASIDMYNFRDKVKSFFSNTDAGALMASAWCVDRVIDVLEKNPDKGFDPKKVMVTGCSFAGKGALTTAAFCDRIALGVVVESGACGSACWRAMKYYRGIDPDPCTNWQGKSESGDQNCKPQTIDKLEQDWLGTVAAPWRSKQIDVDKLPLDQHFVIALCAPRPCLIVTNSEAWHWLCPKSETVSAACANAVYDALGVADHFGYVSGQGYMHCGTTGIAHHVDACKEFYSKFYYGTNANTATYKGNTDIFKCNNGFCLDTARWVDWNMNVTLQ